MRLDVVVEYLYREINTPSEHRGFSGSMVELVCPVRGLLGDWEAQKELFGDVDLKILLNKSPDQGV
jgi:hypothetical protein